MRVSRKFWVALSFLAAVHLVVLCAGFFAPYHYSTQNRAYPFAPPTRIHFIDSKGGWHWRPFAYAIVEDAGSAAYAYKEDVSKISPLRFFVTGEEYRLANLLLTRRHLFGVDGARVFVMGTDAFGRDQFSRLLYGGQISLFAGLIAAALSLFWGTALATVAGYYGKWADEGIMRFAELFIALPWLYLLFAVRAFLPLHIPPANAFLLLIAVIGLVGWARPARLVRGIVLSAKQSNYVLAAANFGASDFYLMRRHILPQALSVVLTQAALLVPLYILAEVTLSFLGLGVAEPLPSWGNLLASLQQYYVLSSYWWMFLPGLTLVPIFLAYFSLAGAVQERVKSAIF
jgi:peptide/nickel transport system permease protein